MSSGQSYRQLGGMILVRLDGLRGRGVLKLTDNNFDSPCEWEFSQGYKEGVYVLLGYPAVLSRHLI